MSKPRKKQISLENDGAAVRIDYDHLRSAVLVLRAINHDLRKQMIDLLEDRGELTVTEIFVTLRVEQSIASQHLGILRKAGVVETRRDGKFIYYSLNKERLSYLAEVVKELSV